MADYDQTFFDYVNAGALRSAQRVVPVVREHLHIESVLDVGCGQGAWLSVWSRSGVPVVQGIDGDYVVRDRLLIDRACFQPHDLSHSFDLGRQFDLVQSLEVAEHLPASSASAFVASLVRHGGLVLFSAAPRGQGGDHHINEQSYDYWRAHFATHGYRPIDLVRSVLRYDADVEVWYRYNTILYASPVCFQTLPAALRRFEVPEGTSIPDVSPFVYRIRKFFVGMLSAEMMTTLAKWKERRTVSSL